MNKTLLEIGETNFEGVLQIGYSTRSRQFCGFIDLALRARSINRSRTRITYKYITFINLDHISNTYCNLIGQTEATNR